MAACLPWATWVAAIGKANYLAGFKALNPLEWKLRFNLRKGCFTQKDCLPKPLPASNAVDYVKFYSRSHDAVIRVYDDAGAVIETHEYAAGREW